MDAQRVIQTLNIILKIYKKILSPSTQGIVIPQAQSMIRLSKESYERCKRDSSGRSTPIPWGYTIHHSQPLQFIAIKVPHSIELQAEVYCEIKWEDDDIPVQQDIKVRIWSKEKDIIFNRDRDSESIEEILTHPDRSYPGRVVSRFHLDKANPNQKGPKYHLQYGGVAEDYELCWHPKKVNVPRLNYPPMELFLTCQVIAANFFPGYYGEIRNKSEWIEELQFYQNILLRPYYERCMKKINDNESLLDYLESESFSLQ